MGVWSDGMFCANRVYDNSVGVEFHVAEPFVDKQVESGVISYGVSSFGYDIRIANEFKVFHNLNSQIVDPKHISEDSFEEIISDDPIIIPPNSFVLGRSYEYIRIPRNVIVICVGKSSYARAGLFVGITPLEPSWFGHITIEISNSCNLPAKIYPNEGIAQLIFFQGAEPCRMSYADKKGKYQGQTGITLPRIKE